MAIIVPEIGNPNASLASSLITPGYPMVVVAHSHPLAPVVLKETPTVARELVVASATIQKAIVQSGHQNDRSL
jgi:hypothetical protein